MKIVIAYEWKYKEKHWLHELLEDAGYVVCIVDMKDIDRRKKLKKWHKIVELYDYYNMAKKAQNLLNTGDVFIGWCFTTAVFASILNKKNNLIIGLNILIQKQDNLPNKLRNFLYKQAFKNTNFKATSNSESSMKIALSILGEQYADCFMILHDVFFEKRNHNVKYEDYCFCGGASGRDWSSLMKAAELCPTIKFKVIAGSGTWNAGLSVPQNVECKFDVTESEFSDSLKNSNLVLLPLISEVTSGLLVLFQAINSGKIVIATGIDAVKYYYPQNLQNKYLVPIGDYKMLAEKIKLYYQNFDNGDIKFMYDFNSQRNMQLDWLNNIELLIKGNKNENCN